MASEDFARLCRLLAYEPSTGALVWRVSPNRRIAAGSEAGNVDKHGYRRLTLRLGDGRRRGYAAHRIAWLLVHGDWPVMEIDHINGDKADNRLANLRDVDRATNGANRVRADRDSKTGLLGASPHRSKFLAQIRRGGHVRYLGLHDTAQGAHEAHAKAKAEAA